MATTGRRWIRPVLATLAGLGAALALFLWLNEHRVRATARVVLEDLLASILAGQVHIDRVDSVGLGGIEAESVTVIDPAGRPVMHAQHVSLGFDPLALLGLSIRFTHGVARDVRVRAYPSEATGVTLFDAFVPRASEPGSSSIGVRFEHIHVLGLRVAGDVLGLSGVSAEGLEARADILAEDDLRVVVSQATGTITGPVREPVRLARGRLTLALTPFRIEVDARVDHKEDALRAKFVYAQSGDAPATIDGVAELMPVSTDLLTAIGVPAAEILVPKVRGYARVHGAPAAPAFEAALDSAAGPISTYGSFSASSTRVHVRSSALALHELMAYAPPLDMDVEFDLAQDGDAPFTLSLRAPTLSLYGVGFEDAAIHGTYADERFDIGDARVSYAGGHFEVSGFVDADAHLALRVRSRVPEVARDPVVRSAGVRAGLVTDLTLVSDDVGYALKGDVVLARPAYAGLAAEKLSLSGDLRFKDDLLPSGTLRASAAEVNAFGEPLGALTFTASGHAGRYALKTELKNPAALRSARLDLTLTTDGQSFRFVSDDFVLAIEERAPWRGEGDVTIDRNGVRFDRLALHVDDQRLSLVGAYSFTRAYRLDAKLTQFDVGGIRELLRADLADLDGTVDGTVVVSGVPGAPRIDVSAKMVDGLYLGMRDLVLDLKIVYLDERFDLDSDLTLGDGSKLRIYADGSAGTGPDFVSQVSSGNYDFGLEFKDIPFSAANPWLAWYGVKAPPGKLSAQLSAQGQLAAPRFALGLAVKDYVLDDGTALAGDVDLRYDGSELAIQSMHLADASGELVHGSGRVALSDDELLRVAELRSTLAARDFDLFLSSTERRLDALPPALRVPLSLTTRLELHAYNERGKPAVDVSMNGRFAPDAGASCGTTAYGTLSGDIHITDAQSDGVVDFVFQRGDHARARLRANVPLSGFIDGSRPLTAPPTALALNVASDALEELPFTCEYAAGPVRAQLEARDLFATPPDLTFSMESPSLQLVPNGKQRQRLGNLQGARTLSRPLAVTLEGGLENDRVDLRARLDAEAGGSAALEATIPGAAFRALEAGENTRSEIRLEVHTLELAPVLTALPISSRISGIVDGRVRALYDVRTDDVQLSGALGLTAGKLAIAELGQELQDVRAQLSFSGDTITLSAMSARDLNGRISANGKVTLAGTKAARTSLALTLRDFPVRREGTQVSSLTGNIDIAGDVLRERMSLEVRMRDLQANLPGDLDLGVQSLDPHPAIVVKGAPKEAPPEDPYIYDLRIVADQPPFRVLRGDLNADVQSDLSLRYRDPTLTLEGSATLLRGNFEIFGKRFDLEPSGLVFDVPETLDPLVNLHATHRVGGDTIGVRVDGRLSEPKVTFTHSNPAITDTGTIVAQLLGGRAYDPSRRDRDASGAAAGVIAGATAGLLTSGAQRQFGGAVPSVSMESGGTTFKGTRIRAGVQLDQLIERRLGPLRKIVRGAYVEGFVAPGASSAQTTANLPPQSRGGGLLELRFPRDLVGTVEYRPTQNWRVDLAWEP